MQDFQSLTQRLEQIRYAATLATQTPEQMTQANSCLAKTPKQSVEEVSNIEDENQTPVADSKVPLPAKGGQNEPVTE